jgi:hypothetical protein
VIYAHPKQPAPDVLLIEPQTRARVFGSRSRYPGTGQDAIIHWFWVILNHEHNLLTEMAAGMRRVFVLLVTLIPALAAHAQILRPIGTNLADIQDWSSEYVFVDAFAQSRKWIPHEYGPGAPWSSNVAVPLGPQGYPLEIPYSNGIDPPQAVRSLLFFGNLHGRYPSGYYRLMASGTGTIRLNFAASGTFSCPVDTLVWVDSNLGGIALEIDTSSATDPVKDIRFIMPGFSSAFSSNPFHPALIDFIADFQVLRFMDWMKTNGSPNRIWSDRNTPDYYSQTLENGVAYEHIIALCNQTQKNPWICIPHRANDAYISELAKLFRDSLDTTLKIYVEYSNEVWNGMFSQSAYADSMGNALGYPGNPWEQGWQFYAKRSADVMRIFENEFSGGNRLIKVISGQAANSWLTNYIVEKFNDPFYNPTQVQANALAIAPYFASSVANDIGNAGLINSITVSDILDSMENSLAKAFTWMDANKTVADTHNLALIAYEGGQHLVAGASYYNDTAYVNKLIQANHHQRMESMYCDYFNYWYDSTAAELMCQFSSHGVYSKYGSWGVKEFMDDTLSPKYLGLKNCVFGYNTDTSTIEIEELSLKNQELTVYPVPSKNGQINVVHALNDPEIYLYDSRGASIPFNIEHIHNNAFVLHLEHYRGLAILLLRDGDHYLSKRILISK